MSRDGTKPKRFLIRLAPEIATKSRRTRRRFQARLAENVRHALVEADRGVEVENAWTRLFVETSADDAVDRILRVFGISSVSPIDAEVPADLDAIVNRGRELYADLVRGRRYAVDARRVGEHDFSSRDIRYALGEALNEGATVDLDHPDVTVEVEVRDDTAYLFADRFEAEGGLPLGIQGEAVCLISGGFDSAVAAWLMLKRGVSLDYVFCNLAGAAYERSVVMVARILATEWSFGESPRLHVVDFEPIVEALQEHVTPRYWQVVLKRQMYRAAELVAGETGGEAIVTGESLGQVSSQTLGNLRAIDDAVTLPVFRPLVGLDKQEIIQLAEKVGTAALSARIREYCAILPDRPVTHAKPSAARDEASGVDAGLVEDAVQGRRVIDLAGVAPRALVEPYIFVDEIPDDARVFDVRAPELHEAWHYPGSVRKDPGTLLDELPDLAKEDTYVLYCDRGTQTANIAELMQRVGFEAYSFRGGTTALRRYVERAGIATPS